MLSLKNVCWMDASLPLLDDLSFDVAPGECIAIELADSRAVSVLIRLLTGEAALQTGSILVDGIPLKKLTPRLLQIYRRSIGVVLPMEKLLGNARIVDTIMLPLRAHRMRKNEILTRAKSLLTKLHMQEKESTLLQELPLDEQKCVALATALVADPQILLIGNKQNDWPDEKNAERMHMLVREAMQRGTSVIIATCTSERFASLHPRIISRNTEHNASRGTEEKSWKTTEKTRIIPIAL